MNNKEKIRLAINQIPINNCDGSANEEAIKAVRYLQEVSQALTLCSVSKQSELLLDLVEQIRLASYAVPMTEEKHNELTEKIKSINWG